MSDPVRCFDSWAPPPPTSISRPPDVIHVMNAPRPSLFFTGPLPCVIVNTNGRLKRGEAWERDYHRYIHDLLRISRYVSSCKTITGFQLKVMEC